MVLPGCTAIYFVKHFNKVIPNRFKKSFMDFLDKLKIQLDLELFEKIKEITNSFTIGEIETRLPNNVSKD